MMLLQRLSTCIIDVIGSRPLTQLTVLASTSALNSALGSSIGSSLSCVIDHALPRISDRALGSAASTTGRHHLTAGSGWASHQWRGYKSNKRSLKPLATSASWLAAEPFVEETQQSQPSPAPIIDSAIPGVPEVPKPEPFRHLGTMTGQYSLELQKVIRECMAPAAHSQTYRMPFHACNPCMHATVC